VEGGKRGVSLDRTSITWGKNHGLSPKKGVEKTRGKGKGNDTDNGPKTRRNFLNSKCEKKRTRKENGMRTTNPGLPGETGERLSWSLKLSPLKLQGGGSNRGGKEVNKTKKNHYRENRGTQAALNPICLLAIAHVNADEEKSGGVLEKVANLWRLTSPSAFA